MADPGGVAVSDADAAPRPRWWQRPMDTPPGPWFTAALVPPTLLMLWSASMPGYIPRASLLGLLALGVLALAWCVRVVAYLVRHRRLSAWLLVAPLGCLATIGLLRTEVPLKARWAVSQSAFEQAAVAARTADLATVRGERRLGAYRIAGVRTEGRAVEFVLAADCSALLTFCVQGFTYAPDATSRANLPEPSGAGRRDEPIGLGDGWFAWSIND